MYAFALKSPSQFMNYLLCPKIQRDELAVKVAAGPSTVARFGLLSGAKKGIVILLCCTLNPTITNIPCSIFNNIRFVQACKKNTAMSLTYAPG